MELLMTLTHGFSVYRDNKGIITEYILLYPPGTLMAYTDDSLSYILATADVEIKALEFDEAAATAASIPHWEC